MPEPVPYSPDAEALVSALLDEHEDPNDATVATVIIESYPVAAYTGMSRRAWLAHRRATLASVGRAVTELRGRGWRLAVAHRTGAEVGTPAADCVIAVEWLNGDGTTADGRPLIDDVMAGYPRPRRDAA